MDEETAKEVADLHNNLRALLDRKRKREETALGEENGALKLKVVSLQDENTHLKNRISILEDESVSFMNKVETLTGKTTSLTEEIASFKDEIEHLTQRLTSSIQRCSQANLKLAQVKQSNEQLDADNIALKKESEQEKRSKLLQKHICELRRKEVANQARTIGILEEEARFLKVENESLQTRVERCEKYEIASKKAVLDLKTRLRSTIEAEFEADDDVTLVSQDGPIL